MKNLFVLIFILLVPPKVMNAQTVIPFSKDEIRIELNNYFTGLTSFISAMENVPPDLNPQSLDDFQEYINDNANQRISEFETSHSQLSNYAQSYDNHHGSNAFEDFINTEIEDLEELPTCFEDWYNTEMVLTASTLACCLAPVACLPCLAAGVASSVANMVNYQNCMEQLY